MGSGGSVASCCWNFAVFAGAKEIFLMGLDLSFPGGQTHIKGSSAEQTWHTKSNRIVNSDKFTTELLHNANVSVGTNYNNAPVLTDSRMKMFAWWFESRLEQFPDVKTYTFSQNGLYIPGIEFITIDKLLSKPEITKEKSTFLSLEQNQIPTEQDFEKAIKSFEQEFTIIKERIFLAINQLKNNDSNALSLKFTNNQTINQIIKMLTPTQNQIQKAITNDNATYNKKITELSILAQNIDFCIKKIKN